jgi:NAD-dependent dihydropyrimidine dehydrogenase PreA subunit
MIELVSASRCITCNKCVQICPMNVFEAVKDAPPIIARQEDCQTCFICELYCPVDALYVAPDSEQAVPVIEQRLVDDGVLGSYRHNGWAIAVGANRPMDQSYALGSD